MAQKVDIYWVIVGFLILMAAAVLIFGRSTGNPLRDKLRRLQIAVVLGGLLLMVMSIFLPSTPSLSTFGYPEEVSQVDTPQEVLKYMQRYNEAIVTTVDVVRWTFFILAIFVAATANTFLSAISETLKEREQRNKNEDSIS